MTELNARTQTAAQLVGVLSGLRRSLRQRVGRVDGASGLTEAQRELVRVVSRQPGIRVGEAAAELQLAPNTVSTLVTTLRSHGWLGREPDPTDGRSARLVLTVDASRRVEEWRDRRLTALDAALSTLSGDDQARIEAAVPALNRLAERLQEQI